MSSVNEDLLDKGIHFSLVIGVSLSEVSEGKLSDDCLPMSV